MKQPLKIIISGGGTGGHIFPAIAIANAIKEQHPDADILFVGAEGRMEMHRVPAAGYKIEGLPVAGFDRKHLFKNFAVLLKLLRSQRKAWHILKQFRPQAVVGVGGYASGPILKAAQLMRIPTLIQEQNSYAGVTNKLLARQARKICVAYPGMEAFFPKSKLILTGNPIRQDLLTDARTRETALHTFGLRPDRQTILILGGSLGARSINECLLSNLETIRKEYDIQFIWQTGKIYHDRITQTLSQTEPIPNLHVTDFIQDMAAAYKAADLIISRAGAGSISEFCLLHKAVILVPSPNVAEDHQTKNALALANQDAAYYIPDAQAADQLLPVALQIIQNNETLTNLRTCIATLALPDSARLIATEVYQLTTPKQQ